MCRCSRLCRNEARIPMTIYSGSCLCKVVQFKIDGEFDSFFLCHCQYCQKDTGSAFAANLFSTSATVSWDKGQDCIRVFQLPATQHCKSFCSLCGAALPNSQMDGKLLVVPAGSLNDPIDIQPTAHIFVSSRANWDKQLEQIPQIDKLPG